MDHDEPSTPEVSDRITRALLTISEAISTARTEDQVIRVVVAQLTGIKEIDTRILDHFRRMMILSPELDFSLLDRPSPSGGPRNEPGEDGESSGS